MEIQGSTITAGKGKALVRVSDGMRAGKTASLGKTWHIGGRRLDEPINELPEHYAEADATEEELRSWWPAEEMKAEVNRRTEEKIRAGHRWRGHSVWLSTENQLNYKAAYDLAAQTAGATLPVTFKFGEDGSPDYYEFAELEELEDFYLSCIGHVQRCLSEGWATKDAIDRRSADALPAWLQPWLP